MILSEEEAWARVEAAELISECSKYFSDPRYTQQTISKAIVDGSISSDSLPAISHFLKALLDVNLPPPIKPHKTAKGSQANAAKGRKSELAIARRCIGCVGKIDVSTLFRTHG